MDTLEAKRNDGTIILKLLPSPTNPFAIANFLLSGLLIAAVATICYYFFPSYVKAISISLIPIALFVFNFKVNIWNIFGVETLVLTPQKLVSTLDYKHIYQRKTEEFKASPKDLKLISSKDGSKLNLNDEKLPEHTKNRFRLYFEKNNKKIYQSSKFITYNEVIKLQEVLVRKKS